MEAWTITALLRWLRGGGWKLVAGAMTALAAGYLIMSLHSARSERDEARSTIEARDGEIALLRQARAADEASQTTRTIYVDRATKEATDRKAKTDEALAANPDWANQPVPPAVINSLR